MKVGGEDVACRIYRRKRHEDKDLLYLRAADSVVVKSYAPPLMLRAVVPEKKKDGEK